MKCSCDSFTLLHHGCKCGSKAFQDSCKHLIDTFTGADKREQIREGTYTVIEGRKKLKEKYGL